MLKIQTGLRDSPFALATAVLGLASIVFVLGFLTLKLGTSWMHLFVQHQLQSLVR